MLTAATVFSAKGEREEERVVSSCEDTWRSTWSHQGDEASGNACLNVWGSLSGSESDDGRIMWALPWSAKTSKKGEASVSTQAVIASHPTPAPQDGRGNIRFLHTWFLVNEDKCYSGTLTGICEPRQ